MTISDRKSEPWWRDTATTLLGRTVELLDVQSLLAAGSRVVTLTGIGKSRVALRTAHEWETRSQRLVAVVDLASMRSGYSAERALLDAVTSHSHITAAPLASALRVLENTGCLVVLDNCEPSSRTPDASQAPS